MVIYIKNMVCNRCVTAVRNLLEQLGQTVGKVTLGEAEICSEPTPAELESISISLKELGFELIEDRKGRIIEQVKSEIITLVHHSGEVLNTNLSTF